MTKFYVLACIAFFSFSNAQFLENFDGMNTGNVSPQSPNFKLWPAAGITDGQVSTLQAFSGDKSLLYRENNGSTTIDDTLVDLGNQTSGVWSIRWMMYVPTNKTAFWNIQNDFFFTSTATAQWNGQFFIGGSNNNPNQDGVGFDQDFDVTVDYPENQWFEVLHVVDMDAKTLKVRINGQMLIEDHPYSYVDGDFLVEASQLGAINFYSIDSNNRYFVDDFELFSGDLLSTASYSSHDAIYAFPNPAENYIKVFSTQFLDQVLYEIVDLNGRTILTSNENYLDVSHLNSGVYLLNVKQNNQVIFTQKVIKK